MITLQTLFDTLATGELVNTKLAQDGHLTEESYPTVINHLNMALIELYKRFNLKQNEVKLMQYPGVTKYYIRAEHLSDENNLDNYGYLIYDEESPLQDDVVKIISVYNISGDSLPLNDAQASYPIMTPEDDVLVMTPPAVPELLYVVYQALYPPIEYTDKNNFNPSKIQLDIPVTIVEAILCYITSRVFNGIASSVSEGTTTPGMTYDSKYEIACKKIELYGLDVQSNDKRQQFNKNGWV